MKGNVYLLLVCLFFACPGYGHAICEVECPGDLTGDRIVNSGDLDVVRGNWGSSVNRCTGGDASGDGFVGSADLDVVRGNWGLCMPESNAELFNTPENPSSDIALRVQVGGEGVIEYQYAFISDGYTSCENADYSSFNTVDTPITDRVGVAGKKLLCVKARNSYGNIQTVATSYEWDSYVDPVIYNVLPLEDRLVGDLNADNVLDSRDIDLHNELVRRGTTDVPTFIVGDTNNSGDVTQADGDLLAEMVAMSGLSAKGTKDGTGGSNINDLPSGEDKPCDENSLYCANPSDPNFKLFYTRMPSVHIDWTPVGDANYDTRSVHISATLYGEAKDEKGDKVVEKHFKLGKVTLETQCAQPDAATGVTWKVRSHLVPELSTGKLTFEVKTQSLKILDISSHPDLEDTDPSPIIYYRIIPEVPDVASCGAGLGDWQGHVFGVVVGSRNDNCNYKNGVVMNRTNSTQPNYCAYPECWGC